MKFDNEITRVPALTLSKLFTEFFATERVAGLLLIAFTGLSLILANSPIADDYAALWHTKIDLSFGPVKLNYSLIKWINDGLMAIFFLLVGLEIERELYRGELSEARKAVLPVVAAMGGMAVPALIHFIFNKGTATQSGIGIPMATDIAFALGMLALLGNKIPFALKIFLASLAIIDDLGAILVIAIFYSEGIQWGYLAASLGIFGILFLLGKLHVYKMAVYILPGIVMWYCMLKSGIHPTLAGVLLAFAVPFGRPNRPNLSYRLQHFLHKFVAFFIIPVFALANTGLLLSGDSLGDLGNNNSIGIIAGLVIGKPAGILLFAGLLIWFGLGKLPEGVNWKHLLGAGTLAGIGFTMSIFISNLAFTDEVTIQSSKIAVMCASIVACIIGLTVLYFAVEKKILSENKE